jgi:DNA-binding GntR family transcriptional regulator
MAARGQASAQIADTLRAEILKETLRPGAKLTEQQLCGRMGVSRTPVREAIGRLEAEGLVETAPNRGAFVVGLSQRDAADMFEIRKQYEVIAARRAAERATKEDLAELDERLEYMRHYTARGDLRKMKQINTAFHETIYKIAGSRLLLVSITRVNTYLRLSIHTKDYRSGQLAEILKEHEAVYRAIKKRDPEKAALAMEKHADGNAARMLKSPK